MSVKIVRLDTSVSKKDKLTTPQTDAQKVISVKPDLLNPSHALQEPTLMKRRARKKVIVFRVLMVIIVRSALELRHLVHQAIIALEELCFKKLVEEDSTATTIQSSKKKNVTSTITAREDHQKRQFHVTINTLVTGELKCKYFALQVVTSSLKPDGEPSINALHVHQANIQLFSRMTAKNA
jgi:hypothetical protein